MILILFGLGVSEMDRTKREKWYEKNKERLKRLRLIDDAFMSKCFEGSPECVELLLHIILEIPGLRVIELRVQYDVKNLQGRSVRLDIYAEDEDGKRYNIEVQRSDSKAKPRRARHNSSLIDANVLLPGDDPELLPESFVIFITEHDVLGGNLPVYHADRVIRETGKPLMDGSHIIYVNGEWRDESPLGRLMHDFFCTDPDEMYYKPLADRVRQFKNSQKGVDAMCEIWQEVWDEGREEGAQENLLGNIKALMENLRLTLDQALDALCVAEEKREAIKDQLTQS